MACLFSMFNCIFFKFFASTYVIIHFCIILQIIDIYLHYIKSHIKFKDDRFLVPIIILTYLITLLKNMLVNHTKKKSIISLLTQKIREKTLMKKIIQKIN